MRVVFFGTPDYSAKVLRAIVDAGHEVVLVVTQPDKRRGRTNAVSPSPVKATTLELDLPVTHSPSDAIGMDADIGVLVAFGRLIKQDVLAHLTILNIHPSLLPRWRGATPVEAAIMAGDEVTGVCVMGLVEEMDAGPIYAKAETAIRDDETADQLYSRLFLIGTELLLEQLQYGLSDPEPQDGEPTFCGRFSSDDFHIDWTAPAQHLARLTRIGKPWTTLRDKRVAVIDAKAVDGPTREAGVIEGVRVAAGDGWLELVRVQPEGKPVQDAQAWHNGARLQSNERFI